MKEIKVITIGNASIEGSQAGYVHSTEGVMCTICACTHGYAIGYILVEERNEEKDY